MVGSSEPTPGPNPVIDTEPTNTPDQFSFKNATFEEVLEELSSRFILNLPEDELAEVERVCFQVEQAHWYYEDFIREEKPSLPSLPLKRFSEILFHSCPLLHRWSHDHETAFIGFMNYKTRVPVCGAIMLNESLTKCVLVKGWKSSAGWGFPKGKVNENEDEAFCAVREVLEETGYNLNGQIRSADCIRLRIKEQPITLFVVPGVPEDFSFKTQTRKEISKIDWFKLAELPTWKKSVSSTNKFYLITPVIGPLKAIVRTLRKARKVVKQQSSELSQNVAIPEADTQPTIDDATSNAVVESPVTVELSFRSQSGEAEISSSQSSSIAPHTPSVNGDLAPHTSDDTLVVKYDFSMDTGNVALDSSLEVPIGALSSGANVDPRSHWSRLMTRLSHSEENSPQETPQALTPTPPVTSHPTTSDLQPRHGSSSLKCAQVVNDGSTSSVTLPVPSIEEQSAANVSQRTVRRHTSTDTPSSISSIPFQQAASNLSTPDGSPDPVTSSLHMHSPPDVLVKRTKQLQLLDLVLAEESARRIPNPPMSAHILGAYPHSLNGFLQDHARSLVRSASVIPDTPRTSITPLHHQAKSLVPTHPGVLPVLSSTSPRHQFNQRQDHLPLDCALRINAHTLNPGMLPVAPPPLLQLAPSASSMASYTGNAVDSSHRGQMLSILSGRASTSRSPTIGRLGTSVCPGGATHDPGSFSTPLSLGNFPPVPTVGSAPRSANAHLLSILNKSSVVDSVDTAPLSVRTRY